MKDYTRLISKQELNEFPIETLSIPVVVIDGNTPPEEIKEACAYLSSHKVLGFDTETKASFVKGESHKVALLQLSTLERAYLFRLSTFRLKTAMRPFRRLIESKRILKVGVASGDDAKQLHRDYGWGASSILELRKLSAAKRLSVSSLSKIYAILFDKRLSKAQRLSDWERTELTDKQVQYAALDAYAGLKIFNELSAFYKVELKEPPLASGKSTRNTTPTTPTTIKKEKNNVSTNRTEKREKRGNR